MEACWHQNRIKNRCQHRKADLLKVLKIIGKISEFSSLGCRSWHQKTIKYQSKIEAQDGSPLGIDFLWILVDCLRQVGMENGAKIDPKRHRKRDEKMDSAKMATKSQQDATTTPVSYTHLTLPTKRIV